MSSPEQVREGVAGYVQEIHKAYLAQALTFRPGIRGQMALLDGQPLTVVAAAARNLHLLATHQPMGPLHGPEVAVESELEGMRWEVRFYDSVVTPELGLIDEREQPAFEEVRHALGISTVIYHITAQPGAGLSAHQAAHVGTGLANGHSSVARDFETIRSRAHGREALVDEMSGAAAAGLGHAVGLLARSIAPHDEEIARLVDSPVIDPDAVRKALLSTVGGRTQWLPQAP